MSCENCSICLSNMGKVNVCVLECGHQFHTTCIIKCTNNKCPLCRDLILKEAEADDNNDDNESSLDNFIQTLLNESNRVPNHFITTNDNDEMIAKQTLQRFRDVSKLNEVFINEFLMKIYCEGFNRAYKIRCIYHMGTMTLFRIYGYIHELDYTSVDWDVVEAMDTIIGNKLSSTEKRDIESGVNTAMITKEDYDNFSHLTFDKWSTQVRHWYVILPELRRFQ